MDPVALIAVIVLFAFVVLLVGIPLRSGTAEAADERERRDIEALQEAKRAKYREIRELEMDFRTGKLTLEDFRAQDRARRGRPSTCCAASTRSEPRRHRSKTQEHPLVRVRHPRPPATAPEQRVPVPRDGFLAHRSFSRTASEPTGYHRRRWKRSSR